jgi:hypothetical protein
MLRYYKSFYKEAKRVFAAAYMNPLLPNPVTAYTTDRRSSFNAQASFLANRIRHFLFLVLGCANLYACSCKPTPSLLEAFETSELVVMAKLVEVNAFESGPSTGGGPIRPNARMIIDKSYKGQMKVGEDLNFRFGGSNCDYFFDQKLVGSQYLIYLSKADKVDPLTPEPAYRLSYCGRSSIFSRAVADLAYLENIEKYRGRTRVSGMLVVPKADSSTTGDPKVKYPSVGDVVISFISRVGKIYTTTSHANGMFELYDLPPGEYEFRVKIPAGWRLNGRSVLVREKQHSDVLGLIEPETRISGKVSFFEWKARPRDKCKSGASRSF